MTMESIPAEGDLSMLEELPPEEPCCPICGTEIDDYLSCGCYEDLHYGA